MTISDKIIFEDNHLLIVNKPSGWLVQGDKTGDVSLLDLAKLYIKEKYGKPGDVFLQPVHRIDRGVSGLSIFARTSKATARMNEIFKNRQIIKTYAAISRDRPATEVGELFDHILKDEGNNQVKRVKSSHPQGKAAHTKYKLLNIQAAKYLFIVQPVTGRPHQIRAQMSWMGCPLFGDTKYGDIQAIQDRSIALHSMSVSFIHPVTKEPQFHYCLPERVEVWREFIPVVKAYCLDDGSDF